MTKKIKDLASVRFGLHANPVESGDIGYLQAKHISEDSQLIGPVEDFLQSEEDAQRHLLKDGDVLLIAKGNRNTAWTYHQDLGPMVASSVFFIISIEDKKEIIPDYLSIYLNQDKNQARFAKLGAGSSIQSLRKSEILEAKINVPSMRNQNSVVTLSILENKRRSMAVTLEKSRRVLFQQWINHLLESNHG